MNKTLEELGFYKYLNNEDTLHYRLDGETNRYAVIFNKKLKIYCVLWEVFILNDSMCWNAPAFESEWSKYNLSQGHWERQTVINIDMDLHNAITNECKELGWLDDK